MRTKILDTAGPTNGVAGGFEGSCEVGNSALDFPRVHCSERQLQSLALDRTAVNSGSAA